jgi:hypothetical protein
MKTSLISAIMIVFKMIVSFWYTANRERKFQGGILRAYSGFRNEIALFMGRSPPSIRAA